MIWTSSRCFILRVLTFCTYIPRRCNSHVRQSQQQQQQSLVVTYKDTTPFIPPIEEGIVVKVYDGDTITVAAKLPYPESPMYRFQVRLAGIDCPEIKGKTKEEKELAQKAKHVVEELVLYQHVTLRNRKTEKYGRILADVYTDKNVHVNSLLIEQELAYVYDGKTKKEWFEKGREEKEEKEEEKEYIADSDGDTDSLTTCETIHAKTKTATTSTSTETTTRTRTKH